jgi:hypothetical protein
VSGGWIDALVPVETADVPRFEGVPGRHLSGLDATYRPEDPLRVELPTEVDEALFRLALLDETTARDIRRMRDLRHAVSARLSGDVLRHLRHRLFEAETAATTLVLLELRDGGALRRLEAALDAERASFVGQRPQVRRA